MVKSTATDTGRLEGVRLEQDVAKVFGGKVVTGSGCVTGHKLDVRTPEFLIECKYRTANKFNLTHELWMKVQKCAIDLGLEGIIVLRFGSDDQMYVVYSDEPVGNLKACKSKTISSGFAGTQVRFGNKYSADTVSISTVEEFFGRDE